MLKGLIIGKDKEQVEAAKAKLQAQPFNIRYDMQVIEPGMHFINAARYDVILVGDGEVSEEELKQKLRALLYQQKETGDKRIAYRENRHLKFIQKDDVLGIEYIGRDSHIHLIDGRCVKIQKPLVHLLQEIDDPYFIRSHKSYAVNLRHITSMNLIRRGIWKINFVYESNFECLVGHVYYDEVMESFYKWKEILKDEE